MRENYNQIKQKFEKFISLFETRDISQLKDIVIDDVHAYFSTVHNKEGGLHTVYGVSAFFRGIPQTDSIKYDICNYVCREKDGRAVQAAEVAFRAENRNGDYFLFVAQFVNEWDCSTENCRICELRMDLKDYESPLRDYFAEAWYFEEPLASLTAACHLPCIFPDLDSPYFQIPESEVELTEEEKVVDTFAKFNYGIDWVVFTYCRDTMSDRFENEEKHHFIQYTKFNRQRFRYWNLPYKVETVEVKDDEATIMVSSLLDSCRIREVDLVKESDDWKIIRYKED